MTGPDMNDEQRLLDGAGSELTRLMISAARDEQPSARALQSTLLAVSAGAAVVGAAAAAGGAAAHAGTTTSVGMIGKWLGIGAAAGLLTAGAALEVERRFSEPPATAIHPPAEAAPSEQLPEPERASAPAAVVDLDESVEVPPARANKRPAVAAKAPAQPVLVEDDPSLAAEVARLDRARQALASGDATRALGELGAYDREFPAGRLGPEASFLRMEAAEARGDRAAAERAARELLANHPNSPHAARARAVLGASKNP